MHLTTGLISIAVQKTIDKLNMLISQFTKCMSLTTSHTRTVVRECFKGDEASQWKRPKFDHSPHQNPSTDLHKNWQA